MVLSNLGFISIYKIYNGVKRGGIEIPYFCHSNVYYLIFKT